ncbi:hypothetical protein F5Y16DRAFT_339683 [Xylariaceae sp. FL0255]|nr:hypothetical protein F5Y16DRAFT_339683 [Xylariaceae sp. FL0255]
MATHSASNPVSPVDDQEDIPLLECISPAVFVPTTRDFTENLPEGGLDNIAELENGITRLDEHARRVEQNMFWMLEREAKRIRQRGRVPQAYYNSFRQVIREPPKPNLELEERLIRETEHQVSALFDDGPSPFPIVVPRGPWDAYPDKNKSLGDLLLTEAVDERRMAPRAVASTWIYNEIHWGWKTMEGHAIEVQKEKDARRAQAWQGMQLDGSRPVESVQRPLVSPYTERKDPFGSKDHRPPTPMHRRDSMDSDKMDLDG